MPRGKRPHVWFLNYIPGQLGIDENQLVFRATTQDGRELSVLVEGLTLGTIKDWINAHGPVYEV